MLRMIFSTNQNPKWPPSKHGCHFQNGRKNLEKRKLLLFYPAFCIAAHEFKYFDISSTQSELSHYKLKMSIIFKMAAKLNFKYRKGRNSLISHHVCLAMWMHCSMAFSTPTGLESKWCLLLQMAATKISTTRKK